MSAGSKKKYPRGGLPERMSRNLNVTVPRFVVTVDRGSKVGRR
jgi:hypothetical protein